MIAPDVRLGTNVTIYHPELVNLYGCVIGDGCRIGSFVEIRKQVTIGRDVPAFAIVAGVPARVIGDVREKQAA